MCELFQYSSQNYHPSTQKALSYLEACNSIFEKGFLSHQVIKSMESDVLKSIDEGYKFFTDWLSQIIQNSNGNLLLAVNKFIYV